MEEQPLTIEAFQKHIYQKYYTTDRERGTPATFMWLIEEVGELATALHQTGAPDGQNDQAARHNLEEEFADVLAWLCTLANVNGVDLTQAIKKKYLTGSGSVGHK